ncbi:hypothetical protein CN918_30415 [Priestia megaterium]|nr:hypothetical protein CN918_30415 [Priestia megaterium]
MDITFYRYLGNIEMNTLMQLSQNVFSVKAKSPRGVTTLQIEFWPDNILYYFGKFQNEFEKLPRGQQEAIKAHIYRTVSPHVEHLLVDGV